jgi:hypothetical protein
VRLPREQHHDDEDPGSHDRKLHRPKGDATRERLWHE